MGSDPRRRPTPPPAYGERLERHLEGLALSGRGDDARGRNFHALSVLDWAFERGWLGYRPARDPARWLLLLLDLVGGYAGLDVHARLGMPFGAFLETMGRVGLGRVAAVTLDTVGSALERPVAPGSGRARVARTAAATSTGRSAQRAPATGAALRDRSMLELLWALAYDPQRYRRQVHFEKHSQGKIVRHKIAVRLDGAWATALAREARLRGGPDGPLVLAAFPPAFGRCYRVVESSLRRCDDSLTANPFAVFYALATDAARGGRVWAPPAALVDGELYSLEDFRAAVGRAGRRERNAAGAALAELGLSAYFPQTVALLDGWLERSAPPELRVRDDPGEAWHALARRAAPEVRRSHDAVVVRVAASLERRHPRVGRDPRARPPK